MWWGRVGYVRIEQGSEGRERRGKERKGRKGKQKKGRIGKERVRQDRARRRNVQMYSRGLGARRDRIELYGQI